LCKALGRRTTCRLAQAAAGEGERLSFTNSTFLDAFGAGLYTQVQYDLLASGQTSPLNSLFQVGTTAATVTDLTTTRPNSIADGITVGLVLDRANDPSSLLSGHWAQRQAAIAALANAGGPWTTYGADATTYGATQTAITNVLGSSTPAQMAASTGYVSTSGDRTIWLTLTPGQFHTLFGQDLLSVTSNATTTRCPCAAAIRRNFGVTGNYTDVFHGHSDTGRNNLGEDGFGTLPLLSHTCCTENVTFGIQSQGTSVLR